MPSDLSPRRSQHAASNFLFHQQKTHLALSRCFHQLDRFSARMSDDEWCADLVEGFSEDLNRGRHPRNSRIQMLSLIASVESQRM